MPRPSATPLGKLIVEGRDDREVVFQLCNAHDFDNRSAFDVPRPDGYELLVKTLRSLIKTGAPAIGVIVDADDDLAARWQSLRATVASKYPDLPDAPSPEGVILEATPHRARFGAWVMPDNTHPGMLEDFVRALAADGDALLPLAEAAVDGIPAEERRFKTSYRSKALIHTWLAWQEEPGTPMGQAITKRYLEGDKELAQRFMTWLTTLFAAG